MVTQLSVPYTGMSQESIIEQARRMLEIRHDEKERLDKIHAYLRATQTHPVVPTGSPNEVHRLARMSRVNIMPIVVSSVAQAMYVDGYRQERESEDAPAWEIWSANALDARQVAVHRASLTYGTSYVTVLPGEPLPVIKGYSPRYMTTIYGDDDYFPEWALSAQPSIGEWAYRLYDDTFIYFLRGAEGSDDLTFVESRRHDMGVVPVIRFLNQMDLDEDNVGEIEPLMELQDQIDLTTFSLLVSQHYQAFRQRYVIGWTAESENQLLKASAAKIWTFEDNPEDVKVGEFGEVDLKGYLESRESSLRHAATLSQTPVHELIGSLVNLSAEALVAAEAGMSRKRAERQMSFGESWEQVLSLAAETAGMATDDQAQVRWRDTESRALAATVDALGKMAQMLGIPPQELWERIPNVSQQDVERWKMTFEQGNALGNLTALLDQQSVGEQEGA